MESSKHLGISEETKAEFEQVRRKLAVVTDEDHTHNSTVKWLIENAPDPMDVEE